MKELQLFSRTLHYYESNYQKLPLLLWRETSAQHFDGGEGGNYPRVENEWLADVDVATFECTSHPFEEMLATNFRNDLVHDPGFVDHNLRVIIPILKVWNVTSMAANLHPVTLGGRDHEIRGISTADCTHFCPTFGGMYEIWATLLQNILAAAHPLEVTLRPMLIRNSSP
jgi:hypothetical protein